jgi:hypothetical protein
LVRGRTILVVGVFRTVGDERAGLDGPDAGSAQIVLAGLETDAVARICELYAAEEWSLDEVRRLRDRTGGVPLLVHEEASGWAHQRAARRADAAADRLLQARVRLASSRREIADSVEGIQRLLDQREAQVGGRRVGSPASATAARPDRCPYKGLARFEASDAAIFFGRERLVAELVARLPGTSLLAVVGPSGSGKSSLVRAGLLPALASGVLPGSERWQSVVLCPGERPARELDRRLRGADRAGGDRRVLFVDQFEEAFTLCRDDAERTAFIDCLVDATTDATTVAVLAIRADHIGGCAAHPELAELLTGNDVLVGPMRPGEIARAIEQPARRSGIDLESGLIDAVVADVAGRPGALPLLSTALAETWERRRDGRLTLAGYRQAGGVDGALARLAEDTYVALPEPARGAARRVLLRLCDAGEDLMLDLRRRLPRDELVAEDSDAEAAVEALVGRRLLVADRDTIEVAHEALLREWPRLHGWLDEDVQGRRLHHRLTESAQAWERSGHDPSELYRGARLEGAVDWARRHRDDMNRGERAFIDASEAEAAREIDHARRQIADKARTNRRLRLLVGGVAGLLVIALVAGLLAWRQQRRAEETAATEQVGRLVAESERLLDSQLDRALLLAVEARRRDDTPATRGALLTALTDNLSSERVQFVSNHRRATAPLAFVVPGFPARACVPVARRRRQRRRPDRRRRGSRPERPPARHRRHPRRRNASRDQTGRDRLHVPARRRVTRRGGRRRGRRGHGEDGRRGHRRRVAVRRGHRTR